ncbi:hypothetical protein DICA0_F38336 [Diutina catenulata]
MDYYWRKSLGHGAVTSKFRVTSLRQPMDVHDETQLEDASTHHPSNCNRCYRLKKKCSRERQGCVACKRHGVPCVYTNRPNKRRRREEPMSPPLSEGLAGVPGAAAGQSTGAGVRTDAPGAPRSSTAANGGETGAASSCASVNAGANAGASAGAGANAGANAGVGAQSPVSASPATTNPAPDRRPHGPTNRPTAQTPSIPRAHSTTPPEGSSRQTSLEAIPPRPASARADPLDHTDRTAEFEFVEPHPAPVQVPDPAPSKLSVSSLLSDEPRRAPHRHVCKQVKQQTVSPVSAATQVREEFTSLGPVADANLPMVWFMNYSENFGHTYPFLDLDAVAATVRQLDFRGESIVPLEVYVVLAIGSITFDARTAQDPGATFDTYFSRTTIEHMIEVVNLAVVSRDDPDAAAIMRLLLLLAIYSVVELDDARLWIYVGLLARTALQLGLYRPSSPFWARVWWSVFNLDTQLSLLRQCPPGLVDARFVTLKLPITDKLYPSENLDMVNKEIERHQLQADAILPVMYPGSTVDAQALHQRLVAWRDITLHNISREASNVEDAQAMVNVDFYYLAIEIARMSGTDTLAHTLAFLSNSFRLALREETDKPQVKQSLSLFWYKKLFKVIDYFSASFSAMASQSLHRVDLSVKLTEYMSNLSVMVNLLKYLQMNHDAMEPHLASLGASLAALNSKLTGLNVMTNEGFETFKQITI